MIIAYIKVDTTLPEVSCDNIRNDWFNLHCSGIDVAIFSLFWSFKPGLNI